MWVAWGLLLSQQVSQRVSHLGPPLAHAGDYWEELGRHPGHRASHVAAHERRRLRATGKPSLNCVSKPYRSIRKRPRGGTLGISQRRMKRCVTPDAYYKKALYSLGATWPSAQTSAQLPMRCLHGIRKPTPYSTGM